MSQNNNTKATIYVGVDIAKQSLEVAQPGRSQELSNDAKGHRRFLHMLGKYPNPVHVILEASGGYERALVRVLHKANIALTVLEPSRVRAFAQAKGLRAKTDPIDARVLREFGQTLHPQPSLAPSEEQLRLAELVSRRSQLIDSQVAESNRSAHYIDPLLRRQAAGYLRL